MRVMSMRRIPPMSSCLTQGNIQKGYKEKIFSLCSEFCKNTDIKLVFTSEKISSYFSTKDILPSALRSGVVYKFKCAGCNACYVGQTTRHFDTRVHEHLYKKSQPSSVYKHLDQNPRCRQACDETCFSILDRDVSSFRLEVKETIHNEWIQPTINKQRKLLKLSILIQNFRPNFWPPFAPPPAPISFSCFPSQFFFQRSSSQVFVCLFSFSLSLSVCVDYDCGQMSICCLPMFALFF